VTALAVEESRNGGGVIEGRARSALVGDQAGLESADNRAERTRCEKPRPKRTGAILADWRKPP
jgi:hypothetical protein